MKTLHTMRATLASVALAALTVLPASGIKLEGTFAGTTRYVSKSGSDSNGGTSWDDAKLTIQAAVDLCADGDTVIVDDGEYSDTTAWTAIPSGSSTTYNNPCVVKIAKRIHLVSRNGKHKTHIVGQWASSSTGVANDGTAHRCIYVDGPTNAKGTLIEGFTIRDGATAGSGTGNNAVDSAGGVCGGASGQTDIIGYLVDCNIENCRAGLGAALSRGIVPIRCAFVGNQNVQSSANPHVFYRGSYAYNCVFSANGSSAGGALLQNVQGSRLVNCTFIDNTCGAVYANGGSMQGFTTHNLLNCAILGGNAAMASATTANNTKGVFLTNCVQSATTGRMTESASSGISNCKTGVAALQHWYAADVGEWKFVVGGDLKDAGTDDALAVAATFVPVEYLNTDFLGNPRKVGGHIDIGAIEAQSDAADPALGTIQLGSGVAVRAGSGIASLPRGFVSSISSSSTSVSLVALRSGDRRFVVTGSESFSRYPGDSSNDASFDIPAAGSADVVNLADPAAVFYVDAVNGNDANDGKTPATAKKTLAATLPSAAYGSIVHAARGDYDEGSQTYAVGNLLDTANDPEVIHSPSRGVVRAGVLLVADEGPDVTFISGTIDNSNGNGIGESAVRCITAVNASVVRGFTLRNGGTFARTGDAYDENMGGLVISLPGRLKPDGTALFENCVFSNGYARTAGLVAGGIFSHCKFSGGHSTSGANISMYSRFENCLLLNDATQDTGMRYSAGMHSCTYIATKGKSNGANVEFGQSQFDLGACFVNSILATPNMTGGNAFAMKNMTNCLFVTGGGNATVDPATSANVITVATVADALAMLDDSYAPLAGSALVDAGDRTLLAKLAGGGATDLAGGQRIYGGQVDVGAFEYDLRPAIAKALNRRVAVSAAGEEVVLADGVVRIPDGAVEATITDTQDTSLLFPVEVTGTGTLSIYLGASDTPWQTLTASDGAQELRLAASAGTTALRFAYAPGTSDTGYASIGALASTTPFVLVVR